MGRSNCCVNGKYDGLFYVDYDDLSIYTKQEEPENYLCLRDVPLDNPSWEYNELLSEQEYNFFIETLTDDIINRFPSFVKCNKWLNRDQHVFLENELFFICTEDNVWSVAVELIAIDDASLSGLQARHYKRYLDSLKSALFMQFRYLYIYAGPWTSGKIENPNI